MTDPLFAESARTDRYAEVAVERGLDGAARRDDRGASNGALLTYRVPEGATETVQAGSLVRVPLGRSSEPVRGVVMRTGGAELLGSLDPARVRDLGEPLPAELPESLLRLAEWISEYYVCPTGMALGAMLPSAVKRAIGARTIKVIEPVPETDRPELWHRPGDPGLKLPPVTRAAWDAVLSKRPNSMPAKEMARALGLASSAPLNRLVALGLMQEREQRTVRKTGFAPELSQDASATPHELNAEQAAVVEDIGSSLGTFLPHVLLGVTGSGKTEVYLHAIQQALDAGKSAIVLVPEIALTPQTAGRFVARFGIETVAVLHSAQAASQRHAEWSRAASGEARVVLGPRSAIFAPVRELGLVIVDEEHDSSYKQDQLPRYHGRDVAIKRAHLESCPVVLGSATPSLETWHNAARGRFKLHRLDRRAAAGARLPEVRLVDLTEERRQGMGRDHRLGPTLRTAMRRALARDGQVVLLLNRRGLASYTVCANRACGWVHRCERCDAAMVRHRARTRAGSLQRCHHCLDETTTPSKCPACGGPLIELEAGTQRVEDEVKGYLEELGFDPETTFSRVDSDSMRNARAYFETLGRFARGETRVLLGTQMIAKGLDVPGVELVGVISADTALAMPDFRADERAFQLVSQVAGRAGRGDRPALVLVQTESPGAPALTFAAAHDYEGFANQELQLRARFDLPPAARMARVVCRDRDPDKAWSRARDLAETLASVAGPGVGVTGPEACALSRIADFTRVAVDLTGPDPRSLHTPLAELRSRGLLKSDAHTAVDPDPIKLL
ncbi:MAG: primosomal protein N' [Planctomycetota bacterium]